MKSLVLLAVLLASSMAATLAVTETAAVSIAGGKKITATIGDTAANIVWKISTDKSDPTAAAQYTACDGLSVCMYQLVTVATQNIRFHVTADGFDPYITAGDGTELKVTAISWVVGQATPLGQKTVTATSTTDPATPVTWKYSTDGSAPATSCPGSPDTLCTVTLTIAGSYQVKFNGAADGYVSYTSETSTDVTLEGVAATEGAEVLIAGGKTLKATATAPTTGLTWKYSTDGTDPASGTACATAADSCTVTLTAVGSYQVKFYASANGYLDYKTATAIPVSVAAVAVTEGAATPIAGGQTVTATATAPTTGLTWKYSTDGTDPASGTACATAADSCTVTLTAVGSYQVKFYAAANGFVAYATATAIPVSVAAVAVTVGAEVPVLGGKTLTATATAPTTGLTWKYTTGGSDPAYGTTCGTDVSCTVTITSSGTSTVRFYAAATGYAAFTSAGTSVALKSSGIAVTYSSSADIPGGLEFKITATEVTAAGATVKYTEDATDPATSTGTVKECPMPCTLNYALEAQAGVYSIYARVMGFTGYDTSGSTTLYTGDIFTVTESLANGKRLRASARTGSGSGLTLMYSTAASGPIDQTMSSYVDVTTVGITNFRFLINQAVIRGNTTMVPFVVPVKINDITWTTDGAATPWPGAMKVTATVASSHNNITWLGYCVNYDCSGKGTDCGSTSSCEYLDTSSGSGRYIRFIALDSDDDGNTLEHRWNSAPYSLTYKSITVSSAKEIAGGKQVDITASDEGDQVKYTEDGTDPTIDSKSCTLPCHLVYNTHNVTNVNVRAKPMGFTGSGDTSGSFTVYNAYINIEVKNIAQGKDVIVKAYTEAGYTVSYVYYTESPTAVPDTELYFGDNIELTTAVSKTWRFLPKGAILAGKGNSTGFAYSAEVKAVTLNIVKGACGLAQCLTATAPGAFGGKLCYRESSWGTPSDPSDCYYTKDFPAVFTVDSEDTYKYKFMVEGYYTPLVQDEVTAVAFDSSYYEIVAASEAKIAGGVRVTVNNPQGVKLVAVGYTSGVDALGKQVPCADAQCTFDFAPWWYYSSTIYIGALGMIGKDYTTLDTSCDNTFAIDTEMSYVVVNKLVTGCHVTATQDASKLPAHWTWQYTTNGTEPMPSHSTSCNADDQDTCSFTVNGPGTFDILVGAAAGSSSENWAMQVSAPSGSCSMTTANFTSTDSKLVLGGVRAYFDVEPGADGDFDIYITTDGSTPTPTNYYKNDTCLYIATWGCPLDFLVANPGQLELKLAAYQQMLNGNHSAYTIVTVTNVTVGASPVVNMTEVMFADHKTLNFSSNIAADWYYTTDGSDPTVYGWWCSSASKSCVFDLYNHGWYNLSVVAMPYGAAFSRKDVSVLVPYTKAIITKTPIGGDGGFMLVAALDQTATPLPANQTWKYTVNGGAVQTCAVNTTTCTKNFTSMIDYTVEMWAEAENYLRVKDVKTWRARIPNPVVEKTDICGGVRLTVKPERNEPGVIPDGAVYYFTRDGTDASPANHTSYCVPSLTNDCHVDVTLSGEYNISVFVMALGQGNATAKLTGTLAPLNATITMADVWGGKDATFAIVTAVTNYGWYLGSSQTEYPSIPGDFVCTDAGAAHVEHYTDVGSYTPRMLLMAPGYALFQVPTTAFELILCPSDAVVTKTEVAAGQLGVNVVVTASTDLAKWFTATALSPAVPAVPTTAGTACGTDPSLTCTLAITAEGSYNVKVAGYCMGKAKNVVSTTVAVWDFTKTGAGAGAVFEVVDIMGGKAAVATVQGVKPDNLNIYINTPDAATADAKKKTCTTSPCQFEFYAGEEATVNALITALGCISGPANGQLTIPTITAPFGFTWQVMDDLGMKSIVFVEGLADHLYYSTSLSKVTPRQGEWSFEGFDFFDIVKAGTVHFRCYAAAMGEGKVISEDVTLEAGLPMKVLLNGQPFTAGSNCVVSSGLLTLLFTVDTIPNTGFGYMINDGKRNSSGLAIGAYTLAITVPGSYKWSVVAAEEGRESLMRTGCLVLVPTVDPTAPTNQTEIAEEVMESLERIATEGDAAAKTAAGMAMTADLLDTVKAAANQKRVDVAKAAFEAAYKNALEANVAAGAVTGIVKTMSANYKVTDTITPGAVLIDMATAHPLAKDNIVAALRSTVATAKGETIASAGAKADMSVTIDIGTTKGTVKVESDTLKTGGKINVHAYRCSDVDGNVTVASQPCISVLYNGAHGGDTQDVYTISIPFVSLDGCKILKKTDEFAKEWTEELECEYEAGPPSVAKYSAQKFSIIRVEFAETSGLLVIIIIIVIVLLIIGGVFVCFKKFKNTATTVKKVKEVGFANVANPLTNSHVPAKV